MYAKDLISFFRARLGRPLFASTAAWALGMTPLTGHAGASPPLCDSEWGERFLAIAVGERKNDGQPLKSYDPANPFEPYELQGNRYLFGRKGWTYKTVGRFTDPQEGEEALKTVYAEKTYLYTGAYPPYLANLGPYLVNPPTTCKVDRNNPVTDPSSWILEKDKLLLAGTTTACQKGQNSKKVTVISCDGKKNLLTDIVSVPCDTGRVTTCIHPVTPGIILFEHYYSSPGAGTSVKLRVYDTARKKKLNTWDWVNEGGPEAEVVSVRDVDEDGVPEIVRGIAEGGRHSLLLKWRNGKFAEVKSP